MPKNNPPKQDTVTPLVLRDDDARDISAALADVLCWFCGFRAARGNDDDLPPSLETLRTLNIKLKRAFDP